VFVDETPESAAERARREHKLLLVDVWAPWCHTCLSMKSFVLGDPALAPLADLVVASSIDFDKVESAAFIEKYRVTELPTFLMFAPESGALLGAWIGSASARELRSMVEGAIAEHRGGLAGPDAVAARAFAEACRARARSEPEAAAVLFRGAIDRAPPGWP